VDFLEFTGNMGSMAIQDWTVSIVDLSWMVHDNKLSLEGFDLL
jgi:hypothetical protein